MYLVHTLICFLLLFILFIYTEVLAYIMMYLPLFCSKTFLAFCKYIQFYLFKSPKHFRAISYSHLAEARSGEAVESSMCSNEIFRYFFQFMTCFFKCFVTRYNIT